MKLQASKRDTQESVESLRQAGNIPAVCYGPDVESTLATISDSDFTQLIRTASSSTIVDLDIDGEEHEVLIKQIDRHPVTEQILHVDFYAIKRGVEMEINVPIVFVGESPAVKQGGVLTEVMHELHVRCRPRSLPEQIEIDLSVLAEVPSHVTVADVTVGEGVTILSNQEDTIVTVSEALEEPTEEEGGSAEDMAEVLADKSEEAETTEE